MRLPIHGVWSGNVRGLVPALAASDERAFALAFLAAMTGASVILASILNHCGGIQVCANAAEVTGPANGACEWRQQTHAHFAADQVSALTFHLGDITLRETAEAYLRVTLEGANGPVTGIGAQHMEPRWFYNRAGRTAAGAADNLWANLRAVRDEAPGACDPVRKIWRESGTVSATKAAKAIRADGLKVNGLRPRENPGSEGCHRTSATDAWRRHGLREHEEPSARYR